MPAHDRSVLVISHDSSLRDIYALLFHSVGYVANTSEIQELPSTLLNGTALHLIVMDHTLSQEERKAGVQIARQLMPDVQTVILHASGKDCGADLAMDSREGAQAVLDAVERLVTGDFPES